MKILHGVFRPSGGANREYLAQSPNNVSHASGRQPPSMAMQPERGTVHTCSCRFALTYRCAPVPMEGPLGRPMMRTRVYPDCAMGTTWSISALMEKEERVFPKALIRSTAFLRSEAFVFRACTCEQPAIIYEKAYRYGQAA